MSGPTNWRIPDWKDSDAYPTDEVTQMNVWAWEFLRRNEEYRHFWIEKVLTFDKATQETRRQMTPYHEELQSRFGILFAVHPSEATGPRFIAGYTYSPEKDGHFTFALTKFQVLAVVDLRLSLEEQFRDLLNITRAHQLSKKDANEIDPKRVRRSKKYRSYLRILDADASGAERSETEPILFPNVSNAYEDDRRRSKMYDNHLAEARRLRDFGYRALGNRDKKLN
jgi:hypothetical protein